MDNILSYYSILKLLHVIGMSAWFGTALTISIIWSKQDKTDLKLILDLISKVEMPASFFIPLTGVLMTIDQTYWLSFGWIQLKIWFHAVRHVIMTKHILLGKNGIFLRSFFVGISILRLRKCNLNK